jgi:hypothetical protein
MINALYANTILRHLVRNAKYLGMIVSLFKESAHTISTCTVLKNGSLKERRNALCAEKSGTQKTEIPKILEI